MIRRAVHHAARRRGGVAGGGARAAPARIRRIGILSAFGEDDPEARGNIAVFRQALETLAGQTAATRGSTIVGAAPMPRAYEPMRLSSSA